MKESDGIIEKTIRCDECGTTYIYYQETEDEEKDSAYISGLNDQGFGRCPFCGGIVAWSGDFCRQDFDPDIDEQDDAIVRNLRCSGCGCNIEVWEPSKTEMESGEFPFWNKE